MAPGPSQPELSALSKIFVRRLELRKLAQVVVAWLGWVSGIRAGNQSQHSPGLVREPAAMQTGRSHQGSGLWLGCSTLEPEEPVKMGASHCREPQVACECQADPAQLPRMAAGLLMFLT